MANTAVTIVPSVIREQIEGGMKKKELAEYYGLPMAQMTKALQTMGLKIRKFHAPKFIIAEEEEVQTLEETLAVEEATSDMVVEEQEVTVQDNW